MAQGRIQSGLIEYSPLSRLSGLCLYVAWVEVIYSGDTFLVPTQAAYSYTAAVFPISTFSLCLGLLFMSFRPEASYKAIDDRRFVMVCAILGAFFTLLVSMPDLVPGWCFCLAAFGTGVMTSIIAMRCAVLLAELDSRSMLLTLSIVQIVAILIYSFVTAMAFYLGAAPALAVLCLLLPLAALLLSMGATDDMAFQDELSLKLPKGFWRLLICMGLFLFACCSARGYFPNLLSSAQFSEARWLTALGLLTAMIAFTCWFASMEKDSSFGVICYYLLLALTLMVAFVPVFGFDTVPAGVLATTLFAVMLLVVWAIVVRVSYRSGASVIRVFGFGYAAAALGSDLGFICGDGLYQAGMPSSDMTTISFVMVIACVAVAFFLLRKDDMESMMVPRFDESEADEPQASGDATTAATHADASLLSKDGTAKPMFRYRCEHLATRYGLSARESEVLYLMAKGNDARAISDELFISFNTARTHIRNIYGKMDVHNRHEFFKVVNDPSNDI